MMIQFPPKLTGASNGSPQWRQKAAAFGCRTVCIGLIQPQGETNLQLILGAQKSSLIGGLLRAYHGNIYINNDHWKMVHS